MRHLDGGRHFTSSTAIALASRREALEFNHFDKPRNPFMTRTLPTLLMTLFLAVPAGAQQKADDHSAHPPAASGAAAAAADMTDAEVRKVDVEAAKLTLKHGEIKSLQMPPMTMVFNVKDKALLAKVKAGDKVRFRAVQEAGKYTVTDIQVVP